LVNRVTARTFIAGIVLVTALLGGYLALEAANVQLSNDIWTLYADMAEGQRQNSQLEAEIAHLSSISALRERAAALGFSPAESIDYLQMGTP
jgi:cell division protein FtsL